jgi:hypothetical protein
MQKKGVFLIRESINFPGEYTLCVQMVDKIEHYHITYHDNKLTIDKETLFNNLVELIQVCGKNNNVRILLYFTYM